MYPIDGKFDVSSDIEKLFVIGIPHATDQDSARLPSPAPPPPSLHVLPVHLFQYWVWTQVLQVMLIQDPNFLRRENACLGPKVVPPVKRQKSERYFEIIQKHKSNLDCHI